MASMTNPPVTMEQVEREKARAAIGGQSAAPGTADVPVSAPPPLVPESRFAHPAETPFRFTPRERQEIRNTNIPLTIGLLASIVAAFVVFFISLASGTAGEDPILPSFWRALGALAVLMTLSFAASWFMPMPANHRRLLDQIEAEEQLTSDRRREKSRVPREQPEPGELAAEQADSASASADKGGSVDVTVADEVDQADDEDDDNADDDDEEMFDEDDEDDDGFMPTGTPVPAEASAGEQGR